MAPSLESVKNFDDVPTGDSGVDMVAFLEATQGLIEIMDFLGSAIFGLLNGEIKNSQSAVKAVYESNPEKSGTLEKLLRNGTTSPWKEGASKLVYLLRCLQTVWTGMNELMADPEAQSAVCFQRGYDKSLGTQHSWVIRGVVSLTMRSAPKRSEIFEKLEQGCPPGTLEPEMTRYYGGLRRILDHMAPILKERGYGDI